MAYPKSLKEAEEYYKRYNKESAAKRLEAWKEANPSAAPAKKAEKKVEDKADEE
jgi:hypothetical protein|tara:strand:+ start:3518 stop:3679 length:162 start_codon:yes stop_codon:yes gene_type:complete